MFKKLFNKKDTTQQEQTQDQPYPQEPQFQQEQTQDQPYPQEPQFQQEAQYPQEAQFQQGYNPQFQQDPQFQQGYNQQNYTPLQLKRMQEEAEAAQRKSFYDVKESKKGMSEERKQELQEMNQVQNKLRYYNTIRSKDIDLKSLKQKHLKGIRRTLKSNKTYTYNEIEKLFNDIAQQITEPLLVNILSEDTSTGHMYYFNEILLEPGKQFNVIAYIQYDLSYFAEVDNAPQLFIAMSRQYQAERQLQLQQEQQYMQQNQGQPQYQDPQFQGQPFQDPQFQGQPQYQDPQFQGQPQVQNEQQYVK